MATKPVVTYESVRIELTWDTSGVISLSLEHYDNISSWQVIDQWETHEPSLPSIAWAEAMFGWEAFCEQMLRSHGMQLELPFP